MKKTICIFFAGANIEKIISHYKDVFQNLPQKYEKVYLVNFYNIIKNNQKSFDEHKKFEEKHNIKIFCPITKKDFEKFVEDRLIFAFDNLGKTIDFFKIRSMINKKNVKLVLLQNIGYFSNQGTFEKDISTKNFYYLMNRIFIRKLFRILVFFKFFSPIFMYFECRRDIVNSCQKHEKKFKNKDYAFNYLYFENTFFINSRSYDEFLKKTYEKLDDKIIFIDGNYKHQDVLQRENFDMEEVKSKYFSKLEIFLKKISKILGKEVIFCLHPTSNLEEYKKLLKDVKFEQFNTQKNIYSSSIVIFHESSSIDTAVFLKKKIISLETGLFGKYLKNRIKKYQEQLGIFKIDLDDKFEMEKKYLEEKIKVNEEKYNNYINNYLKSDEKEEGILKVYRILDEHFNLLNRQYEK